MAKGKPAPVRQEPDLRKQTIEPGEQRDAIHVAIVPLIAGDYLSSGQEFKLAHGSTEIALRADYDDKKAIGVVNPFMKGNRFLQEGDRFWGLLYPGTVTGMRHEWAHPAFDNPPQTKNEHEAWLREFCDEWNFDFDELIEAGTSEQGRDEDGFIDRYVIARGRDLHSASELGHDLVLFWEHLEGFTGKTFDEDHREGIGWSCSC